MRKTPYRVTTAALPWPAGQLAASCGPTFIPLIDASRAEQGSAALPRAAASQQAGAAASKHSAVTPMSVISLESACSGQAPVIPSVALPPQQAGPGQEAEPSEDAASPERSPRLEQKRATGRLTSYKRGTRNPRTESVQRSRGSQGPEAAAQKTNAGGRTGRSAADRNSKGSKQGQACAADDRPPCVRSHDVSRPTAHFAGPCIGAEQEQPAAAQQPVQSLAERYAGMKRTVTERLTCGAAYVSLR